MPNSTFMFEHYTNQLRKQPRNEDEVDERDRHFEPLSTQGFYRNHLKPIFSAKKSIDPQSSHDRFTVRQSFLFVDEADTQMENLHTVLSFMTEGDINKAVKIQLALSSADSLRTAASTYSGVAIGAAIGSLLGPGGTIGGGAVGAILVNHLAKKVYKNSQRLLFAKYNISKPAQNIYPSTSAIDAKLATAFLSQEVEPRDSQEGGIKAVKSLLKQGQKLHDGGNIGMKWLNLLPLADYVKIAYGGHKAKKLFSDEKISKLTNLLNSIERTLEEELLSVDKPFERLTKDGSGVKVSIRVALKEFQNYRLPEETAITLEKYKKKHDSALEFIAQNRKLLNEMQRSTVTSSVSAPSEWEYLTGEQEIAALQDLAEKDKEFKTEDSASDEIYEGDSLTNPSNEIWKP